ncbi:MAG: hypothetical protein ACI4SB_00785 [Acutalibacteraceae bacterium]
MLFRKILQKSKGRKLSRSEKDMYISRGAVQSDGGTLCPALDELIKTKTPITCDDGFYERLERSVKEKSKGKNPLFNIFILTAMFMVLTSIQGSLVHAEGKSPMFIADLRIMCIAVIFLLLVKIFKKKNGARLNDVRRCIERREGVTVFSFYINELCWYDDSKSDGVSYDAYLFAEKMLFYVSYDMFNSARPGDYFTAVVVDTGFEKVFYILNIGR